VDCSTPLLDSFGSYSTLRLIGFESPAAWGFQKTNCGLCDGKSLQYPKARSITLSVSGRRSSSKGTELSNCPSIGGLTGQSHWAASLNPVNLSEILEFLLKLG
jgi:hypothetical protein